MSIRPIVTKVHLGLAVFFLPFLLILPLSGGLYLLGIKGHAEKTEAFTIEEPLPAEESEWPGFFRARFRSAGIDFEFEKVRVSGDQLTFRPSTRTHFEATRTESGAIVRKVDPDWILRLQELHWGHGPALVKWVQTAFALALLMVTGSGAYLAFSSRLHRKTALAALAAGVALILAALL